MVMTGTSAVLPEIVKSAVRRAEKVVPGGTFPPSLCTEVQMAFMDATALPATAS
jgi:hypothetical protein